MEVLNILIIIFNIISVYYAARNNKATWYAGIIACALLGFVLFHDRLYMSAIYNAYCFIISIIGSFKWRNDNKEKNKLKIKISETTIIISIALISSFTAIIYSFNRYVSIYPLADSICTSMSCVALWLLSKKDLSNWFWWIISDLIYVIAIGIWYDQYQYIFIYGTMLILAIYGMLNWIKIYFKENV